MYILLLPLCTIVLVVMFRNQHCSTLLSVTPVCSGDPGPWSRHRIRHLTRYLQKNVRDSMLNRGRMFLLTLQFYIRLPTGWTVRESKPGWGEIFRTCPDRPSGPPTFLYNGYRVFPVGKLRSGRDADPSPPSSDEVINRVELYLYSP